MNAEEFNVKYLLSTLSHLKQAEMMSRFQRANGTTSIRLETKRATNGKREKHVTSHTLLALTCLSVAKRASTLREMTYTCNATRALESTGAVNVEVCQSMCQQFASR